MSKIGDYALKGLVAGAILGAGLAIITLHWPLIIGAAIGWGISGAVIGAIMGAISKDDGPGIAMPGEKHHIGSCREPSMEQGQGHDKNPNHYRDMVCDSRVAENVQR